jgi:thioredoxin 1
MSLKILSFSSLTCGPCKAMKPIIDELQSTYPIDRINVDFCDIDTLRKYNITSVPTLLFIKNDAVVRKKIGYTTKKEILSIIKNHE